MQASVLCGTRGWPATGGVIRCSALPAGEISASPMRWLYRVPPLASAAYALANCSVVTSTSPWLMAAFTASPGSH